MSALSAVSGSMTGSRSRHHAASAARHQPRHIGHGQGAQSVQRGQSGSGSRRPRGPGPHHGAHPLATSSPPSSASSSSPSPPSSSPSPPPSESMQGGPGQGPPCSYIYRT